MRPDLVETTGISMSRILVDVIDHPRDLVLLHLGSENQRVDIRSELQINPLVSRRGIYVDQPKVVDQRGVPNRGSSMKSSEVRVL